MSVMQILLGPQLSVWPFDPLLHLAPQGSVSLQNWPKSAFGRPAKHVPPQQIPIVLPLVELMLSAHTASLVQALLAAQYVPT